MQGCACRTYLQRHPHEEPQRRSRQTRIVGCPQPESRGTSDLPERSCAAYFKLRRAVKEPPAPFVKVHVHRTHLRHANEHHTIRASGWARNVQGRARKVGDEAARWHGTTHSRSSVALSMAGQSGVALDQWFEASTHTFDLDCVSAADERSAALLGGPHWPPKRNLRNELSDLVSGRCETRR